MKRLKTAFLIILLFSMATGCILGNKEGTISGTVINSAGEAIPEVKLSIASANLSTTSDSTGYFILSGLKVGSYDVLIQKSGYVATTTSVELPDPGTLSCSSPSKKANLTLPLTLANITGLINDTPASTGYDFTETSTTAATKTLTDNRVTTLTSARCDVYFAYNATQDKRYLVASDRIQDLGYKNSLDDIGSAPTTGYVTSTEAIANHCYAIKTVEGFCVKLRIEEVSNTSLYFKWSMQPVSNNNLFSPKL